jgi:dephospho-CoA kinase
MILIGLTGGIGMGKSTVADFLVAKREFVVDTDVIARDLVKPGEKALRAIEAEFGSDVIGVDGALDRGALGKVVFQSEERRRALEQILHPPIRQAWKDWAEERSKAGTKRAVVVIPLLFETEAEKELDLTICVACSAPVQRERLRSRSWSDNEIGRRIAAQIDVRKKMEQADRVVWNEASIEVCQEQVTRIFNAL